MLVEHVVRLFDRSCAKVTKTALDAVELEWAWPSGERAECLDAHRLGSGFARGKLGQAQGVLRATKPEVRVDGTAQHRFAGGKANVEQPGETGHGGRNGKLIVDRVRGLIDHLFTSVVEEHSHAGIADASERHDGGQAHRLGAVPRQLQHTAGRLLAGFG